MRESVSLLNIYILYVYYTVYNLLIFLGMPMPANSAPYGAPQQHSFAVSETL